MADVTLLFGLGATKAGTSWLQSYLERHKQVHLWRHKELHYFNSFDQDRAMQRIDHICEKRMALRKKMRGGGPKKLRAAVEEYDRYLGLIGRGEVNAGAYVAFLKKGRRGADVVGDITPAYALLTEERLRMMAGLGPKTRFIYILREPVDRLWSNVRMMAGWQTRDGQDVSPRARWIFDRWSRGEEEALSERCDYIGALSRICAAVPEKDRLFLFYEELFTEDSMRRICAFLGIEYQAADLERRVHQSPAAVMDPERHALAAEALAPETAFVEKMFGRLPEAWQRATVGA